MNVGVSVVLWCFCHQKHPCTECIKKRKNPHPSPLPRRGSKYIIEKHCPPLLTPLPQGARKFYQTLTLHSAIRHAVSHNSHCSLVRLVSLGESKLLCYNLLLQIILKLLNINRITTAIVEFGRVGNPFNWVFSTHARTVFVIRA